jgi:hypothetical protein
MNNDLRKIGLMIKSKKNATINKMESFYCSMIAAIKCGIELLIIVSRQFKYHANKIEGSALS